MRIRGGYDDALYKSTFTYLLTYLLTQDSVDLISESYYTRHKTVLDPQNTERIVVSLYAAVRH